MLDKADGARQEGASYVIALVRRGQGFGKGIDPYHKQRVFSPLSFR